MKEINEKTVKENLSESLSESCRWRVQQGLCEPDGCVFCPVNDIYKTMRSKAVEFLKQFTRCHTDCCINYKQYGHGRLVESIPFASAVEKFIKDYKEMSIFLQGFDIEDSDKAFEMTCQIWKNHIVSFS